MAEPQRIPPEALVTMNNMKAQMNIYLQGVLVGMGVKGAIGVSDDGMILFPPASKPLEVKPLVAESKNA